VPVPGIAVGGELHVRGPNVMLGYYRFEQPGVIDPPASSLGQGWYDTGDIVTVDDDGYLAIKGRKKRFTKIAGEMINPETTRAHETPPAKRNDERRRLTAVGDDS
jgi:acyl-[acyl-carrier-protein]-phospholipid O-acyltransferase/long-chain-fatty-acid--[acyl-carrier-protein] ligase